MRKKHYLKRFSAFIPLKSFWLALCFVHLLGSHLEKHRCSSEMQNMGVAFLISTHTHPTRSLLDEKQQKHSWVMLHSRSLFLLQCGNFNALERICFYAHLYLDSLSLSLTQEADPVQGYWATAEIPQIPLSQGVSKQSRQPISQAAATHTSPGGSKRLK